MSRPAIQRAELRNQEAVALPARETLCALGCTNVTTVVGVNLAIAVNAATINGAANAVAQQHLAAFMP